MAVRFDASTDTLRRTSGAVISYNAAYAFMCWAYISVDRDDYGTFLAVYVNDSNADNIEVTTTGTDVRAVVAIGASYTDTGTTALTVGAWNHVALVRESATSLKLYLNGTQAGATVTTNVGSRGASTAMSVGVGPYPTDWLNGRVAYVKAFDRSLTADEIAAEMWTAVPVGATPWGWWPLLPGSGERGRDYSGNARDLTEGGTLTDEDGPPVLWAPPLAVAIPATAAIVTTPSLPTRRARTLAGLLPR